MKKIKHTSRRGSHTTAIPLVLSISQKLVHIKYAEFHRGIRLGKINSEGRPNGEKRLKIQLSSGGLLLKAKDGKAIQELTVYTTTTPALVAALKEICKQEGVIVNDATENI